MASTLLVHAERTDRLLHAGNTAGVRQPAVLEITLVDETGNVLVDQNGNELTAFGLTSVILIHAERTDRLLHAEE